MFLRGDLNFPLFSNEIEARYVIIGLQAYMVPLGLKKSVVLVFPYPDSADLWNYQLMWGRVSSILHYSITQKEELSLHFHPLHHLTEVQM